MKVVSIKTQTGYTLVEIILALVIASAIIGAGYKWYVTYRLDQDLAQTRYNVDMLFQAMARYYQANCRDRSNAQGLPDSTFGQGALSPSKIQYPPQASVAINLVTDLQAQGYLTKDQPPFNPIVQSYVLQFNPVITTRHIYACNSTNPELHGPCEPTMPEPVKSNLVVIWRAQVAVLLTEKHDPALYANVLGANCTSNLGTAGTIKPCKAATPPGPTPPGPTPPGPTPPGPTPPTPAGAYIVWDRLPSFASPSTSSELWSSLSVAKQFNQQYTNDDFYAFNVDDPVLNNTTNYENYLCGG